MVRFWKKGYVKLELLWVLLLLVCRMWFINSLWFCFIFFIVCLVFSGLEISFGWRLISVVEGFWLVLYLVERYLMEKVFSIRMDIVIFWFRLIWGYRYMIWCLFTSWWWFFKKVCIVCIVRKRISFIILWCRTRFIQCLVCLLVFVRVLWMVCIECGNWKSRKVIKCRFLGVEWFLCTFWRFKKFLWNILVCLWMFGVLWVMCSFVEMCWIVNVGIFCIWERNWGFYWWSVNWMVCLDCSLLFPIIWRLFWIRLYVGYWVGSIFWESMVSDGLIFGMCCVDISRLMWSVLFWLCWVVWWLMVLLRSWF